jgi:hypothetical protein
MQAISADLYSQAAEQDAPGAEGGATPEGDAGAEAPTEEKKEEEGEVIDADFEMVDDDKK